MVDQIKPHKWKMCSSKNSVQDSNEINSNEIDSNEIYSNKNSVTVLTPNKKKKICGCC